MKLKQITVESDLECSLAEWKSFIEEMIEKYGEDTIMFTDAGYNNVSLIILAEK